MASEKRSGMTVPVNLGWGYRKVTYYPDAIPGVFPFTGITARLVDTTDGTSQTASMSEWRTAVPFRTTHRIRSTFTLEDEPYDSSADHARITRICENIESDGARHGGPDRGTWWYSHLPSASGYTHSLPPNRPSCSLQFVSLGLLTASSTHSGGVNLLYLDGHVKFTTDNVNRDIWHAISTRAGNETIWAE